MNCFESAGALLGCLPYFLADRETWIILVCIALALILLGLIARQHSRGR